MDNVKTELSSPIVENKSEQQANNEKQSAENFQTFIYELFEKNGILNDLRAYLRQHIVNVLKSAHTGDTPACQKHFAQRLELTIQAINMLIAEYLLRFEFGYSLSVFVSEMPLGNMVFDFASSLMKGDGENQHLRFQDKDVWSILNYLGVKLDSEHVSNVIQMYKQEEHCPLLLCILKCLPMYHHEDINVPCVDQASTSEATLSTHHSTDTLSERPPPPPRPPRRDRCRHYSSCRSCHTRVTKLRDRYRKQKMAFVQKEASLNSVNVKNLLNNISAAEGSLVDEVFDQLKTVYEAEVDMVRAEEEKKMKRSLANHALKLIHHKREMEEAFKAREEELERNVRQKKKFLWGLARSLREQHDQMSRAMVAVKCHTHSLSSKEDNLRTQLLEAEESLKHRGEEMRAQISSELVVLETHLEDMKREKDSLNRERSELEEMRAQSGVKIQNINDNKESSSNFDQLRTELSILRKYVEATRSDTKRLVERSTVTDLNGVTSKLSADALNNEHNVRACREDDRLKNNQLVNDFKKQKNVNFCISNMEDVYCERQESCAGLADTSAVTQLRHENEQLREYARMQQQQIEQLSRPVTRFQPVNARPRTAPTMLGNDDLRVNPTASTNSFGWRKGAGEEITLFADAPTRIVLPGDNVPFIGVLRDRHADTRRHLINQWRALRRASPPAPRRAPCPAPRDRGPRTNSAGPSVISEPRHEETASERQTPATNVFDHITLEHYQPSQRPNTAATNENRHREKSPKSVLREAKENLRTKSSTKQSESREKSPSSVLREAKLRLRKLELEAEAVERSYRDFRRRQATPPRGYRPPEEAVVTKDTAELNVRRSNSLHKLNDYTCKTHCNPFDTHKLNSNDFDKYLQEYRKKFDFTENLFSNRNTVAARVKPIPDAFSPRSPDNVSKIGNSNINNLLETPLTEFRKYYRPQTATPNNKIQESTQRTTEPSLSPKKDSPREESINIQDRNETDGMDELEAKKDALFKEKNCKQVELEILKQNISKMYNIPDSETVSDSCPAVETKESQLNATQDVKNNVIRIEVDSDRNEISTVNLVESEHQDVLVVVQSNVESEALSHSHSEADKDKTMSGNMTILISPKRSVSENSRNRSIENSRRSVSPEQAARLTRNDVFEAIFHADPVKMNSSLEMHDDSSKDQIEGELNSETEKDEPENYTDDFSADVDNYNSLSGHNSPISLPKSPDNFWDS